MEYTEEQAKIVKERWGVPAGTLKTWKRRGKIPDKYASDPIPDREKASYIRLQLTLKDARLNISQLSRISGVNSLADFACGNKKEITYEEFKAVRKVINELAAICKVGRKLEDQAIILRHDVIVFDLLLFDLSRTQRTYYSRLRNEQVADTEDLNFEVAEVSKVLYEFAEQIKC